MNRKSLLKALLAVVLLVFALAAVVYSRQLATPPLVVGEPAPNFELVDLAGNTVKLSDFQGKVVFINFWTTWCDPCKEETPDLEAFYQKYGDQVVLLGINKEDPDVLISGFLNDYKLTYPILKDKRGHVSDQYGVRGVPESYFVGPEGILRFKQIGPMTLAQMEQVVNGIKSAQ